MSAYDKCKPVVIDVISPRAPMMVALAALFVAVFTYVKFIEIESRQTR